MSVSLFNEDESDVHIETMCYGATFELHVTPQPENDDYITLDQMTGKLNFNPPAAASDIEYNVAIKATYDGTEVWT
jgi:hypothetical protein